MIIRLLVKVLRRFPLEKFKRLFQATDMTVAELGMGVSGVALATVIAQAVSALLCFIRLGKLTEIFDLKLKYLKINGKYSGNMIKLGLPSGLTQAIFPRL